MSQKSPADIAAGCIRCGFCLDACPTFKLTANEAESPRGRIYLMRHLLDGGRAMDAAALAHLDNCLGCRACEAVCPSGVRYGSLIEGFRARIEEEGLRPAAEVGARGMLLDTLTDRSRLGASLTGLSMVAGILRKAPAMPGLFARLLTGGQSDEAAVPLSGTGRSGGRLPAFTPAVGKARRTVCLPDGCVMSVLFADVNRVTAELLSRCGCNVVCPRSAGCCGALDAHAGRRERARERARALIDALEGADFDALVTNSAGCGSTLREYGELLADDDRYAARAAALATRTRDISEFLVDLGVEPPTGRLDVTVAYHDACHLAHAQRVTSPPRALLRSIPGLKLVPLAESDLCCGSAGTYNVTHPETATALLDRKVANIIASGASVVAAGNPGCIAWMREGLARAGSTIRVAHTVELLAEAYRRGASPYGKA